MHYVKMTDDALFNYGKYHLFTITYPGNTHIPEEKDWALFCKELLRRSPEKAALLIDMVIKGNIPNDVEISELQKNLYGNIKGKFAETIPLAVLLKNKVHYESVLKKFDITVDPVIQSFFPGKDNEEYLKKTTLFSEAALVYEDSLYAQALYLKAGIYSYGSFSYKIQALSELLLIFCQARELWLGKSQAEKIGRAHV